MKDKSQPIFFLTTAGWDYKLLSRPRSCFYIHRLSDVNRDDYMLVKIDPPLIGQSFGLGGDDIHELLLATRHQGFSLFAELQGEVCVYVARIVDPAVKTADRFDGSQVQLIAWGSVFCDFALATSHAHKFEKELI